MAHFKYSKYKMMDFRQFQMRSTSVLAKYARNFGRENSNVDKTSAKIDF